jgi:hypothetical protein
MKQFLSKPKKATGNAANKTTRKKKAGRKKKR